jgi:hypothetical protein
MRTPKGCPKLRPLISLWNPPKRTADHQRKRPLRKIQLKKEQDMQFPKERKLLFFKTNYKKCGFP